MTTAEVDQLLVQLQGLRPAMAPEIPPEPPRDMQLWDNPRWLGGETSDGALPALLARHGGTGWVGFAFPLNEARSIGAWLLRACRERQRFTTVAEKLASLPPTASSIAGPDFLITSHGGSYFYGQGDLLIGPDPFEQMESDSDRAAGIVAGTIVERCLEFAVREARSYRKLLPPQAGATFRNLITDAKTLGLISSSAEHDLNGVRIIRNKFAHELNLDSFREPDVEKRCADLRFVDKYVGPVPSIETTEQSTEELGVKGSYHGIPDYADRLADPRFRYVMTAQLLSFTFGMAAKAGAVATEVI